MGPVLHFLEVEELIMNKAKSGAKLPILTVIPANPTEALKEGVQHGTPQHGTKDFAEDIRDGLHAKVRDARSAQVRGSDVDD
jgi:hypothetical protein